MFTELMTSKPPPGSIPDWSQSINRGLVGWWLFNEGVGSHVNDISGNGNHGAHQGTPVWDGGKTGPAVTFDGVADYVRIGDNTLYDFVTPFSLSVWVCLETNPGPSIAAIIAKNQGGASANGGWVLYQDSVTNKIGIILLDGAIPSPLLLSDSSITLNSWVHVCVVWDGTTSTGSMVMYFDGAPVLGTETNYGTIAAINSTDITIGSVIDPALFGNGQINNVQIWNRALSANEVQQLYVNPFGGLASPSGDIETIEGALNGGRHIPRYYQGEQYE